MYESKRLIPAVLGVAGLGFAALAPLGATSASAAAVCQLDVRSNKVLNLQDRNGNDEIFFKLGGRSTPVLGYVLNQRRSNIGVEAFQNSIDIKVFERDGANVTRVGTINNVPCQNTPTQTDDVSGSGAIYRVKWRVS